ncbi:MAG: hypothetical protein HYS81_04155 [Candidatus Aenigmatarchaeota archaeon]|nr:MAG: hypothetical protein HYS81_04155 [Candidatus Aenigmarchaeota archaeon]
MKGTLDELFLKIQEGSKLSHDEVEKLVREKGDEFSGLISPEGAAHIVAKELGVNLLERMNRHVKIANVVPGLLSVNLTAKVVRVTEPRTFKKEGGEGKVVNVHLADETGTMRMSLWDDQVALVQEGNLKEGMTIDVVNGYTKEDTRGGAELRVGKKGMIKKSDVTLDVSIEAVRSRNAVRKPLVEAKVGESVEFRGALVQFFENRPFYFVCPQCEKKVPESVCTEHGSVVPKPILMVSGVLDDGTGNMRAVFFREAAERVLGLSTDEAFKKSGNGINPRVIVDKLQEALGKEIVIRGYVKENSFFERPEVIVNEVVEFNPLEEARKLASGLNA